MPDEALGRVCPPSALKWLNSPLRKLIQNPKRIMKAYVKPGDVVVDLGCGGGIFSAALAEMVGENGRVIAADLQKEMLDITRDYVTKRGLLDRVTLHQCSADNIGLSDEKVDFVLVFYVVHEAPNRKEFFRQVSQIMKPDAHFLLIEPKHHVTPSQYENIIQEAQLANLKFLKEVKIAFSRSAVFGLESSAETN